MARGERPDLRQRRDAPKADGDPTRPDRLTTWPHLVRIEFVVMVAAMVILTVWSITIDAPLEQAANPNRTPDPSKAPWYFLGLQEMLVYFDPWIAGVMLPLLIIGGLILIPYLDRNPKGNGYYTWSERRFALSTFLFGFIALWIIPILIGVFCRGPGWNWYWPWEPWDVAKVVDLTPRNLSDVFGVTGDSAAFIFGAAATLLWYGLGFVPWLLKRGSAAMVELGFVRFAVTALLFQTMMALPVKMALRLGLNVQYVWVTPWFNI